MISFNLPKETIVNRFIAKSKFYEKIKVSGKVQQEFTEAIARITWMHKLAESTINISGTDAIEELQIFDIQLKKKEIPKNAIKIIDKAIPSSILYVFEFEGNLAYGITTKENAEQRYFFSEWNEEIIFDFTGTTIEHIYQKVIKLFITNKTGLETKSKNFEEILLKEKQLAIVKREIVALENKVRNAKQFNKQVAFNKALRIKLNEKDNLEKGTI